MAPEPEFSKGKLSPVKDNVLKNQLYGDLENADTTKPKVQQAEAPMGPWQNSMTQPIDHGLTWPWDGVEG